MKPHESPRIRKKSIRGDSGDSWPVWNRGISKNACDPDSGKYGRCRETTDVDRKHADIYNLQ